MNSTVLAIDSVTEACSVALQTRGQIFQRAKIARNQHSRLLLQMANEVLAEAELQLPELDAIAVDVGPGSFTGIRIGIGITQGLSYAAGLRVIAVSSLAALACEADDRSRVVLPAIDARMGQVYYAAYRAGEELLPPILCAPDDVQPPDARAIIGVGSGWDAYSDAMQAAVMRGGCEVQWLPERYPQAANVARIAAARGVANAISPLQLNAAYIRERVTQTG